MGVIEDPADHPGEQGQDEGVDGDHGAVVELVDRPLGDLELFEVLDGCLLVEEHSQESADELGGAVDDEGEGGGPEVGAGIGGGTLGHLFHGVDAALAGGAGQFGGQRPAAEPVAGFGHVLAVFDLHEAFQFVLPDGEGDGGHPGVDLAVTVQRPR